MNLKSEKISYEMGTNSRSRSVQRNYFRGLQSIKIWVFNFLLQEKHAKLSKYDIWQNDMKNPKICSNEALKNLSIAISQSARKPSKKDEPESKTALNNQI